MDSSSPTSVSSSSIYLTAIPTSQMGDVGIGCSHRGLRRQSIFRSAVPVSEDCGCSGVIISHVLSSSSIYICIFIGKGNFFIYFLFYFFTSTGFLIPFRGFYKKKSLLICFYFPLWSPFHIIQKGTGITWIMVIDKRFFYFDMNSPQKIMWNLGGKELVMQEKHINKINSFDINYP